MRLSLFIKSLQEIADRTPNDPLVWVEKGYEQWWPVCIQERELGDVGEGKDENGGDKMAPAVVIH